MALKTEINTPAMMERIVEAFAAWILGREPYLLNGFEPTFEHGQWWVIVDFSERTVTYSVVDATGGDAVDGFSFEEV